jgi:hypothetical protein
MMHMMKRLMIGVALAATLASAALAQNTVPQVGITTGYQAKNTYSSSFFGLVPVVTSGTDEVCISGSATKIVRVQRITIWGTTATAPQAVPLNLVRRASLDTGGTAAATTANPGIATQIASRDTGQNPNTSSTAVLVSYTAAPTIVDTAPVYVDSQLLSMPIVTSVMPPSPADFYFGRDAENNIQVVTLRGATQQLCVNNGAALTNASAWNGSIVWTEE